MSERPSRVDRVDVAIRPATAADAAGVADVYLASFHATYAFPLAHTDDQVRGWLRDGIVAGETGRGSPRRTAGSSR